MQYRNDIQIFRGLAVILVFFYHLNLPGFENGYFGVDIFFVISGFLMGKLYQKQSIFDFYKARFSRLFPPYIIIIISVLLIYFQLTVSSDFSQLVEQSVFSIFYLSNFHFWKMGSYFNQIQFNPLLHFWSLSIEIQFYLVVPLLFPLLQKSRVIFICLFGASFLLSIFLLGISPKTSFYMFPARFWEFLIGAGIAWLPSASNLKFKEKYIYLLRIFAVFLMLGTLFLLPVQPDKTDYLIGHPGLPCILITISFGLIIYFGIGRRIEENIIGNLLIFLGNISYSIYLVHFPLIIILNYKPLSGTTTGFNSNQDLIIICVLTFSLAYFLWRFIERPKYKTNISWYKLSSMLAVAILVAISLNVVHWSKEKQPKKNILLAFGDRSKEYRCPTFNRIISPFSALCPVASESFSDNILLVGDSHADSIKDILSTINSNMNFGTFFSVNPPLVFNSPYQFEALRKDIKSLKPKALIIHYYYNHYNDFEFRKKVALLLKFAVNSQISIYVVAPVPTYKKNIVKYLYQQIDTGQEIDFNLISRQDYLSSIKEFLNFADQHKEYIDGFFYPGNIFCKKEYCEFISKDFKPYYFDDDHLTLTGAKRLEPFFLSIANELK